MVKSWFFVKLTLMDFNDMLVTGKNNFRRMPVTSYPHLLITQLITRFGIVCNSLRNLVGHWQETAKAVRATDTWWTDFNANACRSSVGRHSETVNGQVYKGEMN